MTTLLLAFLVALVLPFLAASWRTRLAGLSAQGLLMGWIYFRHQPPASLESALAFVDLVVLRGALVPLMLYRVMGATASSRRGDEVAPNMLSWTIVGALVAVAFRLASRLEPGGSEPQILLAVAVSGLLLGFFVLATQTGVLAQAVGALRVENAIALFELGEAGAAPLPVRVGMVSVFLLTACLFALYVRWTHEAPELAFEEPTL